MRQPRGSLVRAVCLCLAGCGSPQQVTPGRALAPRAGGAEALQQACIPSGPERCFDAKDDNCNGLIDEGCGMRTGVVQFVLAWDAATADLDLLVTDPKNELAEVGRPTSAGLVKDRDCPGRQRACGGVNFENVYLEKDEAPRGVYRVRVRLERTGEEDAPLRATLGARVGPKTYTATVELTGREDERVFAFSL